MTNEMIDRGIEYLTHIENSSPATVYHLKGMLEAMKAPERSYHLMNEGIPCKELFDEVRKSREDK